MAVERTLILIKPDAVRRRLAGEILQRIESRGFTVVAGKLVTASRQLLVHGSDAPESAQREVALWFSADELP
jgi:nucleoside diphosphate kinase